MMSQQPPRQTALINMAGGRFHDNRSAYHPVKVRLSEEVQKFAEEKKRQIVSETGELSSLKGALCTANLFCTYY